MPSAAVCDRADMITSLFGNARKIQIDTGCAPERCRVIPNGIHYKRFCDIPLKGRGWLDGYQTVVRLAPIKRI